MADDPESSPETTPANAPASGGTSPSGGGPVPGEAQSPLEDLESDPTAHGTGSPFGEGDDPFGGGDPFGGEAFGAEPPALMIAKLWIRQNALLSIGVAFAAGTLIGALKQ